MAFQFPLQIFLVGTSISALRCMHGTSGHLFTCSLSYDEPYHKMLPNWLTCGAWSSNSAWQYLPLCETQPVGRAGRHPFILAFPIPVVVFWDGIQMNSKLASMTSNVNEHLPLLHTNLLKHSGVSNWEEKHERNCHLLVSIDVQLSTGGEEMLKWGSAKPNLGSGILLTSASTWKWT